MAGKIKVKVATAAQNGFIMALNKLTSYPRASFTETFRLSQSKRELFKAVQDYQEDAQTLAKKFGTETPDKGYNIPADKRAQFQAEIEKLGQREVKLSLTNRIKIVAAEVPDKYFTADDLFFLEPLIEVVEQEETPPK